MTRTFRMLPPSLAVVAAAWLAAPAVSTAAPATTEAPAPIKLHLNVQRHQLPNGLRVVLSEDHSAPTVAICVTYDVGSRNEVQGRSGFAHLFEHMMFQGSRNLEKGDHFKMITARGGTLNGTTSSDRTNYFESLPSNALALGLWLEADRMKTLAVTQENFENQRAVVQEEYRMRVSNRAYTLGLMRLHEIAFGDYWPYAHDAIGSMSDLDAAQLEWIRDFHRHYYAPNNAVLAVAGDFDPVQTLKLIQQYFSDAKRAEVPAYTPGEIKPQKVPRSDVVEDVNARTPAVMNSWVIPPVRTPEHYALEMATVVLGFGETSLLHEKLVRDLNIARAAQAWTNDHRGPDLFTIRVLMSEGGEVDQAQAVIDELLERLRTKGPTDAELDKAKNRIKSYFIFGLQDSSSRARQLSYYEVSTGDANNLNTELDHYLAVTPEQVRAAVNKYIVAPRKNVVTVMPKTSASNE